MRLEYKHIISQKKRSIEVAKGDINNIVGTLKHDIKKHKDIGQKLDSKKIAEIESKLGLTLPKSYKTFLQTFGDGAYWLYNSQPIDTLSESKNMFLTNLRKDVPENVPLEGDGEVPANSLVMLMSEDSNGGAWCWLTSQGKADGEWPLAYYQPFEKKLFYKVPNLTEWLRILVENKQEVIRSLDKEDKLELG
jgi:hypothetical protein